MNSPYRALIWPLLLVAVVLAFFGETVFCGRSLVPADLLHNLLLPYSTSVTNVAVVNHYDMDALTVDYPWGVFWQQTVKAGQWPLWNPYILGGHPHLAESMPAVFSPFKVLYLFLSAERAFTLGIIAAFLLTALAMFAFLRELGRSRCAAFLGSCAWMLNSAFVMWYWRAPAALGWTPLVLLLAERAMKHRSAGYAAGAGLVSAVAMLSGNIQATVHLASLCLTWSLMHWSADHGQWRRVALMFIVTGLASAVQWLPTLELMRLDAYGSAQARGTLASVRHTILGLPALIQFAFPALTGSTESYDLLKLADASRGDFTGYFGIVPLTLALTGAIAGRQRHTRWLVGFIGFVVVVLLFTPLVKYLYHRFFIVAVFAGCVLTADGADALLDSPSAGQRVLKGMLVLGLLVLVGVVTVQLVVAWKRDALLAAAHRALAGAVEANTFGFKAAWFGQRVTAFLDHYQITNIEFWLPLACLGLAVAVGLKRAGRVEIGIVLVVTTVVDLVALERRLLPQTDLRRFPLESPALLAPFQADCELSRVCCVGRNAVVIYRPNWLLAWGIQSLDGNFSLAPANIDWLLNQAPTTAARNRVLDLVNVEYLLAEKGEPLSKDHFDLVTERDGVNLYRNRFCLPRAQLVPHYEVVSDRRRTLDRMWSPGFDPRVVVLLEESLPFGMGDLPATGEARVTEYTPSRVTVAVQCSQPAVLLLADTWYPGWHAHIDGQPVKLYRADAVLRAVAVPAGEHQITFYFLPLSFVLGAVISALTVLALVFAALITVRANRRKPDPRTA